MRLSKLSQCRRNAKPKQNAVFDYRAWIGEMNYRSLGGLRRSKTPRGRSCRVSVKGLLCSVVSQTWSEQRAKWVLQALVNWCDKTRAQLKAQGRGARGILTEFCIMDTLAGLGRSRIACWTKSRENWASTT